MVAPTGKQGQREGSLEAPERHALAWRTPEFYDEGALFIELQRVFDICHGCRRCFSLCNAFPTLFDLVDASETMEVDGVAKQDYWQVVDHCYLCDMCFMTKCPYVPPHEWNVDFPKLMLRAKAVKLKKGDVSLRDRVLSSTDTVGRLAGIPVIVQAVNAAGRNRTARRMLNKTFAVHPEAVLPRYSSATLRKRVRAGGDEAKEGEPAGPTHGRVVLFTTCYGNYNEPQLGEDLIAVFRHNNIPVRLPPVERCCGMPKLELGDLEAVARAKELNVSILARLVDEGWDIVAPIPSCVLMLKQEYPLMFPDDAEVKKVADATYDPFEYLMLRHKDGKLKTEFTQSLGKVSYQVPCHLRVQNIGLKTRDVLQLVPDTSVEAIERCSGHDGTYAVKKEFHEISKKIARPVVNKVKKSGADHFVSDCPMAADQIAQDLDEYSAGHPMSLLRKAYGI